jgi:ribose transport system substrate-binding protein
LKTATVLVSLITSDNDYQREQADAAERAAKRLGVSVQVAYADNDAVNQSQQILKAIQSPDQRPDAILVEPVGTGMDQAAAADIGWGVLNREVAYISKLRQTCTASIFAISVDQEEVGRIQGKQLGVLLKNGGVALYLEGPSTGSVARQRSFGMYSTKPENIDVKVLKGDWTEQSGYRAVKSWLSLSTYRQLNVRVIACQNDAMALGARRAFDELADNQQRQQFLSLPFIGCDGVPTTGQAWMREGLLAATIVIPPTAGLALEMFTKAIQSGLHPPEHTLSMPTPFPSIKDLEVKQL